MEGQGWEGGFAGRWGWAPRGGGEHLGQSREEGVLNGVPQASARARSSAGLPRDGGGSRAIPSSTEFSNLNSGVMTELTFCVWRAFRKSRKCPGTCKFILFCFGHSSSHVSLASSLQKPPNVKFERILLPDAREPCAGESSRDPQR